MSVARAFGMAFLGVAVLAGPSFAEEPTAPPAGAEAGCGDQPLWRDLSERTVGGKHIGKKLLEPVVFSFNGDPLTDVLDFVTDVYEVPVWIDREAIEEEGIDIASEKVTMHVAGLPLGQALDLLLEDVGGLTWVIHRHVLKITTRSQAEWMIEARLYDVTGLKNAGHTPESLAATLKSIAHQMSCDEKPKPFVIEPFHNAILVSGSLAFHRQVTQLLNQFARHVCDEEEPAAAPPQPAEPQPPKTAAAENR